MMKDHCSQIWLLRCGSNGLGFDRHNSTATPPAVVHRVTTLRNQILQNDRDAWCCSVCDAESARLHRGQIPPHFLAKTPISTPTPSSNPSRKLRLLAIASQPKMASTEGMKVVNIGTRRSQLAIAQVDMVVKHLQTFAPGPEYRSQVVSTMADENQVKSFQEFNAKSIWTEELEKLLMEKKLDVIVHCLKGRFKTCNAICLRSSICKHRSFNFSTQQMCRQHCPNLASWASSANAKILAT